MRLCVQEEKTKKMIVCCRHANGEDLFLLSDVSNINDLKKDQMVNGYRLRWRHQQAICILEELQSAHICFGNYLYCWDVSNEYYIFTQEKFDAFFKKQCEKCTHPKSCRGYKDNNNGECSRFRPHTSWARRLLGQKCAKNN